MDWPVRVEVSETTGFSFSSPTSIITLNIVLLLSMHLTDMTAFLLETCGVNGPLVGILKQFWVMIVKLLYVESGYC